MTFLKGLIVILNFFFALAGGVLLMLWPTVAELPDSQAILDQGVSAGELASLTAQLNQTFSLSLASTVAGCALIAGAFLFLYVSIRNGARRREADYLEFSDDDGGFRISVKALEQSLARALFLLPEVHDMRVVLRARDEEGAQRIRIRAHGSVIENNDMHEVRARIRNTLRNRFQGMLHLDENVTYDVDILRMIPKDKKGKRSRGQEPLPMEPGAPAGYGISGPRYPVEAESEGGP